MNMKELRAKVEAHHGSEVEVELGKVYIFTDKHTCEVVASYDPNKGVLSFY